MKRILVFGMTENPGGIESVIMNYYRHFDKNKVCLDFLCNTETVAYEEEIKKIGGNIYKITARSKNYTAYKKDINSFFKNNANRYDAIWVNVCSLANIDYLKYAKKYGIKTRIVHCHNSQNMDSFLRGLLHKYNKLFLKKYATDFWSCSENASSWFYSKRIISSNKFFVMNNAIEYDKFKFNEQIRKKVRKAMKLDNLLVFGNVGRLHFQKNQAFALRVFSKYLKCNSNAVFLLIGDGEDKDKLLKLAKELSISDKVFFLGVRDDVAQLLQAIDILLFPSLFEGLSLSLIEAQASKTLVFTSTNVSSETKMSDSIFYIDLANEDEWINQIVIQNKKYKRPKATDEIKDRGFDINQEAKKIENRFINE